MERANQRIKEFLIIQGEVDICTLHVLEQVFHVCVFLAKFQSPLSDMLCLLGQLFLFLSLFFSFSRFLFLSLYVRLSVYLSVIHVHTQRLSLYERTFIAR